MSAAGSALAPDLVSLVRPLLGLVLCSVLQQRSESGLVLPLVIAACISDFADGRMARARGRDSLRGRMVDNLCDAIFLALAFAAMGAASLWSDPSSGWLAPRVAAANFLPLAAFGCAFGIYAVRMTLEQRRGAASGRSRFGHAGGIANYALALAGAAEAAPTIRLGPWVLETAVVAVAILNLAAVGENLRLMFPRPAGGPTMRP